MQVILKEPVQNLGNVGELVNVKAGYARNFLLPSNKAMLATDENIKEVEARKAELEKEAAQRKANAESLGKKLEGLTLTITANVGEEDKLYGSIGAVDIVAALADMGIEIEKSAIRLAEGPFHTAGEHTCGIHLHPEIEDVTLTVMIEAPSETE
ncbi:MAG: 50S ribosomal protein L9 [Gammaproteobacteria bacterium]|nr:MAG: 50S ribosomal protein L9 [Gammaproteobacteria bacterium]